jgi:flavin-dependent dehydrogenase
MLGDAAGNIAPLSGNGISMALHSSLIASAYVNDFLDDKISREEMEKLYSNEWVKYFSSRIRTAQIIQNIFGKYMINEITFSIFKACPFLVDFMSKKIHGESF